MAKRFFYYLVILNMIANIMLFTPQILYSQRFTGAVQALFWAAPIGTFFMYMFDRLIKDFRGKSIVDLCKEAFPTWMQKSIWLYFLAIWLSTGLLSISVFTYIILTYMNPDSNTLIMTILLGGFVSLASIMDSDKILYLLEIVLALSVPFLGFILYKSLVNPYFSWNSAIDVATYATHFPSLLAVSTATYCFSGYANMVIFNQCFSKKQPFKYIWVLGILGFLISIHSFFVPIGFHGTVAIGDLQYPWVDTADSIRMNYGIIERLLYPFLLLYTLISLIHTVIHLHISVEFLKGLFPFKKITKGKGRFLWPLFFVGLIFLFNIFTTDPLRLEIAKVWLLVRFPSEGILLVILYFIKRRIYRGKKV